MADPIEKKGTVLLLKAPRETEEDRFVETLQQAGFRAVLVPVLAFKYINQKQLKQALLQHNNFSGIIFTSPRAVQAVNKVLANLSDNYTCSPHSLRCFVVGQATAIAAKEANFSPEGAETGNAEKLSQFILESVDKEEMRPLLYPCAQMRRDTLLEKLQSGHCAVEEIVAYETVPSDTIEEDIAKLFTSEDPPQSVVFFSPSGVQFTETAVANGVLSVNTLKIYALGPTTQEAIISRGYPLAGVAAKPDPSSLVQTLQQGGRLDHH